MEVIRYFDEVEELPMKILGRLLCRIGLHRWGRWQYWTIDDPSADTGMFEECERCGQEHIIQTPY